MATAKIQFHAGDCDGPIWWDWAELDPTNYSCADAADGLHDWGGLDRSLCYCVEGGTMHTYCTECGCVYEEGHR